MLKVDGKALLVQVVTQEGGTYGPSVRIGHGGVRAPAAIAGGGVFDLDHLGPQAGQQLGSKRQGSHLFDGQDPYTV